MNLPRGYVLVGEQFVDGEHIITVRIAKWRLALVTLSAAVRLARGSFKYRPR